MNELELTMSRLRSRIEAVESQAVVGEHLPGPGRSGARIIGVDAVNSVRSDDIGTVHAANGELKDDGTTSWLVLAHLEVPMPVLSMFHFVLTTVPEADVTIPDGISMPASSLVDIVVSPVLVDWDPEIVTYDNRPTILGDFEILRHQQGVTAGTIEADGSASGYDQDVVTEIKSSLTAFWGVAGYLVSAADAALGRAIHGFLLDVNVVADALAFDATGALSTTLTQVSQGITIPTHYAAIL